MEHEPLEDLPVERRREDRRRLSTPVPDDRRQTDRRAYRLSPSKPFAGVAVVVDTWPLLRAGVRQELEATAMRVAADVPTADEALAAVGDRLDLVILGATLEPIEDAVSLLRSVRLREGALPPLVLILVEWIEIASLRALLSAGVEGVVDRSIDRDDLRAACERLLAGQRVLAGGALSILANAGLDLAEPDQESPSAPSLTRKEREILAQLGLHRSNREIAEIMHVSAATVKTHLSNIYAKLGVGGRRQAVVAAIELGLLS